jgi:hypothetical protein
MAKMVLAAFSDPWQADQALFELEHFGYRPTEVAIVASNAAYETRREVIAKSALTGGIAGAAIGLVLGALAASGVADVFGSLFIAGPIAGALGFTGGAATVVSAIITGLLFGLLVGALTGFGLPRETQETYQHAIDNGGAVIALNDPEDLTLEARTILNSHGAVRVELADIRMPARQLEARRVTNLRQQPTFGERIDRGRRDRIE